MATIEDGVRFIARTSRRAEFENFWNAIFGNPSKLTNQVIEIRGPSERGVQLIFNEFLARMALPKFSKSYGSDAGVLYFNCYERANMLELKAYFKDAACKYVHDEVEAVINQALAKLTVMHPRDIQKYGKSLFGLNDMLLRYPQIGMIVIDNIDHFKPPSHICGTRILSYIEKVVYLKLSISEVKVLTVFVHNNPKTVLPTEIAFSDIDVVLIVSDFNENGLKIVYCDKGKQREVIFQNIENLHE